MFPLLLVTALTLLSLLVELATIGLSMRFFVWEIQRCSAVRGFFGDMWTMGVILLLMLFGHFLQMALWAGGFIWCNEFGEFKEAFYHSAVNYASLGYGDIVMSEEWRLLGGIEAAVGMMMFGVSTALLFSVLSQLTRTQIQVGSGRKTKLHEPLKADHDQTD